MNPFALSEAEQREASYRRGERARSCFDTPPLRVGTQHEQK